ncbi:MAG: peptide deformylase [Candidatus Yanofskybacteria bacterium]|nr:peptide deformylase [Candidatus Yanofskybacteria bacterium]
MQIVKHPSKILSQKLKEVKEITPEIRGLISNMKKQMVESLGVGLAANQVGQNLAIFVIDKKLAEENKVPDAYINPEITEYSKDKTEMEEGCLSLPEYFASVARAKKIKIKALDENGNKIKIKARGFLARVLQHETDHLNGVLIKEKVSKNYSN